MDVRALIFDIGGTVFDWHTAILESLAIAVPANEAPPDKDAFAFSCRDAFLTLNTAVMAGKRPWMTSDAMLKAAVEEACTGHGLDELPESSLNMIAHAWRNMPAWPGARDAIAALRRKYVVAPLTILSWPMAIGSSRRNGIDWDSVLSCDVLGIYKPDPRCYLRTAEIMDCRPEQLMMVAAHPSDLRAAIRSGYRSAYVKPRLEDPGEDYTDTGFDKEFDVVAEDFAELAQKLR